METRSPARPCSISTTPATRNAGQMLPACTVLLSPPHSQGLRAGAYEALQEIVRDGGEEGDRFNNNPLDRGRRFAGDLVPRPCGFCCAAARGRRNVGRERGAHSLHRVLEVYPVHQALPHCAMPPATPLARLSNACGQPRAHTSVATNARFHPPTDRGGLIDRPRRSQRLTAIELPLSTQRLQERGSELAARETKDRASRSGVASHWHSMSSFPPHHPRFTARMNTWKTRQ
jgi:hypothetical protein